jgi:hypothetical protein
MDPGDVLGQPGQIGVAVVGGRAAGQVQRGGGFPGHGLELPGPGLPGGIFDQWQLYAGT